MSTQERKLSFYFLGIEEKDADKNRVNLFSFDTLKVFCEEMNGFTSRQKVSDFTAYSKRCEIQSFSIYTAQGQNFIKGLVRAGKYNHSLDYLSRDGEIRDTDKAIDEAYAEKTHFLGRINSNGIELLFENRTAGASIGMVIQHLNSLWKTCGHEGYLFFNPIAIENMEEVLKKMSRVKIGTIFVDKSYFSDDKKTLGAIAKTSDAKEEIILSIGAKRGASMGKSGLLRALRNVASKDSEINRVRIEGVTVEGNVIIDTYLTKRVNNVVVELDQKGLVDDHSIFSKMEEVFGVDE